MDKVQKHNSCKQLLCPLRTMQVEADTTTGKRTEAETPPPPTQHQTTNKVRLPSVILTTTVNLLKFQAAKAVTSGSFESATPETASGW
jgi:hypothetical protein